MAEITKQALKVDNNQSFPNNNNGAITPSILRAFNVNMIDSMVDEIGYTADSSSWNQQIDSLETFSGSTNVSITNLNASSASQQISIDALNVFTASQSTASIVTSINNLNSFTQSADIRLTNIENTTASLNTSVTNINTFSASALTSISNLNTATGSLFVSASLALVTASINNDDITFTKGDGSQFTIQVATGSFALSASFATSASYAETASYAQFATDIYLNVKNTTGAQLNKGTVVRIIGATGDNALVATASWEDDNNSANTLGFLYENIANDAFGKVITQGTLLGIDTDPVLGYTAGQLIYLSSSGQYTNVIPPAPYHEVRLGQVLRAQQNNGSVYVLIQNGYELSELHDVDINTGSLANNNLLAYNSASGQWENKTLTQVGATTTSSFNSYTSSNDAKVNSLIAATGSYATTGSNSFVGNQNISASVQLNLGSNGALRGDTNGITIFDSTAGMQIRNFTTGDLFVEQNAASGFYLYNRATNVTISGSSGTIIQDVDFIPFSASLNSRINTIIANTGSFATTGSNSFTGSQTITGSITTTQDITVSGVKFGFGNSAGTSSIAIGNINTLQNNTFDNNIAIGNAALQQNTVGSRNIGIGIEALKSITGNSNYNVGIGSFALSQATSSTNTFALGYAAMESAVDSNENIAIGVATLANKKANSNTNTAIGSHALREHRDGDTHGGQNMAFGLDTMRYVTSGSANTAIGAAALRDAARANENVFIGWISGINASGSIEQNVVIGARAGQKMAGSTNTIIGHNAASELVNGGANTFIGQGAGSGIITGSSNTLIGRSLVGVDNWNNVIAISDGAGAIKTKFQSDIWQFTGSVDIQNTLTASLQEGYVWVGNSAGRTVTVATSSFGGGGSIDTGSFATTGSNTFTGDQTLIDAGGNTITLSDTSGSLMLVAKGFTSASAHLSSSAANKVNIIFKNTNAAATTYISGSNNIFSDTQAPTAGFKRQLGEANINLFLALPQVSASMGDYVAIDNNFITARNTSPMTMRGPISSSEWQIKGNVVTQQLNIGTSATNHAQGLVSGLLVNNCYIGANLSIIANRTNTTQQANITNSNLAGAISLVMASSSIDYGNNITAGGTVTINNNSTGSARVSINQYNAALVNSNILGGNTTITFSGSNDPNDVQDLDYNGGVVRSLIHGSGINARVNTGLTGSNTLAGTAIIGNGLTVSGSSQNPLTNGGTNLGSAFFGRYNALDGNRASSAQTVFAIGTGTGTSAASRKTGFLIDSGSNTFIEGTLNVSGSSTFNGDSLITGSLTVSGSVTITGSVSVSNVLSLAQLNPLPTGADGQLAVSGSNLYFFSGSAWNRVSLA